MKATPERRWRSANPEAPYFDGRCEVIVSYNFVHRCKYGAIVMNTHGFAVCETHAKTLRLRDEDTPNTKFVVEQFDQKAAQFRFGHLESETPSLVARLRAIEAQWDF
jgi:hypothetical protein